MNIKEYCQILRKEGIYEYYCNIIREPKDYDRITRQKMCLEILDYIQTYGLESLITYEEYKPLMHLINDDYFVEEENIYTKLSNRLLTVFNFNKKNRDYTILEEFKETIKVKLNEINLDNLKAREEKDMIVGGMIKAYGILSLDHLNRCLEHYCKDDSYISSFANTDYYLQYYNYEIFEYDGLVIDKRFSDFYKEMHNAYSQFNDLLNNNHFISKKALLSIYKNNFDINIKSNKELFNKLKELPYYLQRDISEKILLYCHLQAIIDNNFLPNIQYYDSTLRQLLPFIKKASKNIPCAIFHGLTEIQFLKKYPRIPTGSNAKVKTEDAFLFFKIYFGLLEYTNNKYHIQPELKKIYEQIEIPPHLILPIRDYLFKNLDIIDEFIKKNPYHFNLEELKLVHHFKYSLSDIFTIMKYDDNYAYLLGKDANFAVLGLHSTIEEVIPKSQLPYASPMNLIPFKDTIVYDGIITGISIQFSKNMKKIFQDEFKRNTTYYSIDCEDSKMIN